MAATAKAASLTGILEIIEVLSVSNINGSATEDVEVLRKIAKTRVFNSGTSPDCELVYMGTQTMSGGAVTVDLTALTDGDGATIVTTEHKVRAIFISPTTANTGAITLTVGASNGYTLAGASWKFALSSGNWALLYLGDNAPAISGTVKTIDITGTTTESIKLLILFG